MKDNLNKKSKAVAHQLSLDMLQKVWKLARAKRKQPGDSLEEEIQEVMRANPDKIIPIRTKEDLGKTITKHKRILHIRNKKDENNI